MNWQIGDRAIIVGAVHAEFNGTIVTIISKLLSVPPNGLRWRGGVSCYLTDVPSMTNLGQPAAFEPHKLRPIPDDDNKEEYDGRKKIIWAECPEWQPKELVVI